MAMVVVLPAPLPPNSPTTVPGRAVNVRSSTATTSPYILRRCRTSMEGVSECIKGLSPITYYQQTLELVVLPRRPEVGSVHDMIRILSTVVCIGLLVGCSPSASSVQPVNDRLQFAAEVTIDGQRTTGTWDLPAAKQTYSSRGAADLAIAVNPLLAPYALSEPRTTSSVLLPASSGPRQVLLQKLPSARGIGIGIAGLHLMNGSAERILESTNPGFGPDLFFFDSFDQPTQVVESRTCPTNFRLSTCDVRLALRRVGPGASPTLSRRSIVFASLRVTRLDLPGLSSHPDFAAVIPRSNGSAITTIDGPTRQKIRNLASSSVHWSYLVYRGGNTWAFPADNANARYEVRYAMPLSEADISCCDNLTANAEKKISGQVEYKGQMLNYAPITNRDRSQSIAIVDAAADAVIYIEAVRPRLLELISLP